MLKYPLDPQYTQPLTDERLAIVYDYFVEELVPCLEAEGYPIPDPPSKAQFIDTYFSTENWHPFALAFGASRYSQEEYYRVYALCPQWPPGFYSG